MVDKNKAVVCCLLATSAIMLSEKKKRKRKMWSKKWYFKRNISCDVHLLNELLETDVPWDDAIVVSAGKLGKLWDSLSELRSCVWKTTGKDSSEACATACQNCAVYSVFPSGMTSHSKIAQFNWECIAPLISHWQLQRLGGIVWLHSMQGMTSNGSCQVPLRRAWKKKMSKTIYQFHLINPPTNAHTYIP